MSEATPLPLNVFISYSHKDEALKDELEVHLATLKRQGKIKPWQDRALEAGTRWDPEIKAALEAAQIILLLITPRFMASDYIHDVELKRAMERDQEGTARVIPIILKPVDLKDTPIAALQALPKDAKPVTSWPDQDEAFLNVVQGLRRVVDSLARKASSSQPSPAAETAAAVAVAAPNPFQQRLALSSLLAELPRPQFEQVLFVLNVPAANRPAGTLPQGERATELLNWADGSTGCGLSTLAEAVEAVVKR